MIKDKTFFEGLKDGVKGFGECISIIVNTALLTIVYIFAVGITALFAKIIGKNFLDTKISKKRKTYWKTLKLDKNNINFYKQF